MHPGCEIAMWMELSFQPERRIPYFDNHSGCPKHLWLPGSVCVEFCPPNMRVPRVLSDGHPPTAGTCLALMIGLRLFSFPGAVS